jgi:hypothetical protein
MNFQEELKEEIKNKKREVLHLENLIPSNTSEKEEIEEDLFYLRLDIKGLQAELEGF